MPTFQYTAMDGAGRKKRGFLEAESKPGAFSALRDLGLAPLSLAPVSAEAAHNAYAVGGTRGSGAGLGLAGRLGFSRLVDLVAGSGIRLGESFHYLGLMLQSGSSLAEALDLLGRMSKGRASRVWLSVRDAVERGEAFSQALRDHPRVFPRVYVGMIQVAEGVGKLGQVLERVAVYEEQRGEVQGKIVTAMAYPSVILIVGLGAVYFLLSQVLPSIAGVFEGSQQELPATTAFLLALGAFLERLGPAALFVPFLLVLLAAYAYTKLPRLKARVDALAWRVPLVRKNILARFSGMLGFQLEAGIPLVQALESSAQAVGSAFFQERIKEAQTEVSAGQPLDKVLERQGIYPDIYILTLSTGQRSGKLAAFLLRLARILEREVDAVLKRFVAIVEPLLILGIGLVVGFIVLAIMKPIFELSTFVG